MALLGLRCRTWASLAAAPGPFVAVVALAAEHRLWARELQQMQEGRSCPAHVGSFRVSDLSHVPCIGR